MDEIMVCLFRSSCVLLDFEVSVVETTISSSRDDELFVSAIV